MKKAAVPTLKEKVPTKVAQSIKEAATLVANIHALSPQIIIQQTVYKLIAITRNTGQFKKSVKVNLKSHYLGLLSLYAGRHCSFFFFSP